MPQVANAVQDGFTSLTGGMNAGQATNDLPRNQYAFGMNATARGGYLKSRPGLNQNGLIFTSEDSMTLYTTGRFQGEEWYIPDSGTPFELVSISGHIFRLLPQANNQTLVEDLTPDGDPNMSTLPIVWFCQAEQYMLINDGVDAAFIFDGATLRRSRPESPYFEVPTGTAMVYGNGRVAIVRGKNIELGDIVGGATDVIVFKEARQFNDSFAVPITSGNITGLIYASRMDTSQGQGPLEVHTAGGAIICIDTSVPRQSWKSTTNIQTIGLKGAASLGQSCLVTVNNDSWFRSRDGIRSYIVAQRQYGYGVSLSGSSWGNTAQSREVSPVLEADTFDLLKFSSMVWFDNRLLTTVSPQQMGSHVYHQGLAVLDFDLITSVAGTKAPPAWDGIWMGANISKITKAMFGSEERCFIHSYDQIQGNGFWELSKNDPFDNTCCPIASYLDTGSYDFGQKTATKTIFAADLYYDQRVGGLNFDVQFKPEQYPFWVPWGYMIIPDDGACSKIDALTNCAIPETQPTLYGSRLRFPQPDYQPDNPLVDYPLNVGYDFRVRVSWTGSARIKGLRVIARSNLEESTGGSIEVLSGPCPSNNPLNGFYAGSINGATPLVLSRIQSVTTYRYLVTDIGTAYVCPIALSIEGAEAGDILRLIVVMPTSANPAVSVGGTTVQGSGYAFTSLLKFSFDGSQWNLEAQSA